MKGSESTIHRVAGLAVLATILLIPLAGQATELAVVVNTTSPLTDISSLSLRHVWLGQLSRIEGHKLRALTSYDDEALQEKLRMVVLSMTERELKQYFLRETLKGGARAPERLKDIEAVLRRLKKDSTGIAIIDARRLKNNNEAGHLKVLTVDGKAVGTRGYPLR